MTKEVREGQACLHFPMDDLEAKERCPFLLENDDSKILTCICNYYSLGQAELARALLLIVATENLPKALRIVRAIIWHGPPKHWLCSVLVPSSAHFAWLCLIDFQDLVETHLKKPALLPPWLVKRLEFDVLVAQALLDGAAIYSQVLTAEVASELRAYHAGLLCATSADEDLPSELQVPASFKLPALSLLQVTNQVSPYVNFLPGHTMQRQEQLELFSGGSANLSKAAIQQLYDLCKSQPLLGRCIGLSLAPPACSPALATARRIQQMYLGLTADALLQSLKSDAWRYLKFLEVNDSVGCPQSLLELLSVLLVVVVSDVRPTPALHGRLQSLVSMATSTVGLPGGSASETATGETAAHSEKTPRNTSAGGDAEIANACKTLATNFAQAAPAEGENNKKPWDHLRRLVEARRDNADEPFAESERVGQSGPGNSSRSSALRYSSFLKRIRGDNPLGMDGKTDGLEDDMDAEDQADAEMMAVTHRSLVEAWEENGQTSIKEAKNAYLHRSKIFEAFLTHSPGGSISALRLFSALEDELLRLKSSQSSLPPAFELLQLADPATYRFKEPPITFWDAYFEFTRVANVHCLEYVVETAAGFIRKRDFCTSAWLLAPFPQLKPLVILLCWTEFQRDVESLQNLLDTLWKSYTEETLRDHTKVGDLLVDYWVEVLNYRLSVSWWISKLVVAQAAAAGSPQQRVAAAGAPQQRGTTPKRQLRQQQRKRLRERKQQQGESKQQESPEEADPQEFSGPPGPDEEGPADAENSMSYNEVAADVLCQVTSYSVLYVMRPNLPMVDSHMLLSSLSSLPGLREAQAALERSYDLDFARCYYTVRCAMSVVQRCVESQGQATSDGWSHKGASPTPGGKVIEDDIHELDGLLSSIERTPLKVSVFLFISSLCFARRHHLREDLSTESSPASSFLVPPSVLLSLLVLLRHHLRPLVDSFAGQGGEIYPIIQQLQRFTQETIWRIFISLKDFLIYSQLALPLGFAPLASPPGAMRITEETARRWAKAIGAVIIGDTDVLGLGGGEAKPPDEEPDLAASRQHPLMQLCMPMDTPLALLPSTFIPRMLACPSTLLQRSLKMNDYHLGRQLLQHFPALRGGHIEAVVRIAEQFKDLRHQLECKGRGLSEQAAASSEDNDSARHGNDLEASLKEVVAAADQGQTVLPGIDHESSLMRSLSRPLLAFYVLVDLAVSAAPLSQMSTFLLGKATPWLLSEDGPEQPAPGVSPTLRNFFQNWVERLSVLVEVRPELRDRASLASIILGIETLPSEPALLKSHLNRLHTQRHAILSLVESVDLVKKGQTSASQRTLVDFLSTAIKGPGKDDEDNSKVVAADASDNLRDDSEQISDGLGSSRYLLRFLEYLARVADLMQSASQDARGRKREKKTESPTKPKEQVVLSIGSTEDTEDQGEPQEEVAEVTKLFDVLAERPKAIVARVLFELGGRRQALALSEAMSIDIVEVIINSSFKGSSAASVAANSTGPRTPLPQYHMSMEVVQYLAQHEKALPCVRCEEAPLLATLACLERRGSTWPSWDMLRFAKEQSKERFPSLHRWVEERCRALRAIQWADARRDGHSAAGALPAGVLDYVESPEVTIPEADAAGGDGHTEADYQKLAPEAKLALEAVGNDQEEGLSAAYTKLVHGLIAEQRHEMALQICDEYLPIDSELTDQVVHLYLNSPHSAYNARSAAVVHVELPDHECMYRVKANALAAQLTLDRYKRWDVDTAVQTLSMCLQRIELEPVADGTEASRTAALKQELRKILQRMVSFEKILEVSGGRWQVWQEIEDMSKPQVEDAVAHLLSLQQHDLARTLAQMYGMTDPLHSLELSRLHYLFTRKNDKTNAVNRLLSLPPSQAVSFALQLLDMFDVIQHRALLCQMLLTQLRSWLSAGEEERLRVLHASLQLLGSVSETMLPHFLKLLRKPELIMESLLMNARVDLLKKFLSDFPGYLRDELILRYARKALALEPSTSGEADEEADEGEEESGSPKQGQAEMPGEEEGSGLGGPWCLTGYKSKDKHIRAQHHFEEAPSIGLAERILELCSDSAANAAACFQICNELSLRLHDLTPRYSTTIASSAAVSEKSDQAGTATPLAWQPGVPLMSVRLVTVLLRRLLAYLQGKFSGTGKEVQLKLERSLNNLDFMSRLWHVSGQKVSLATLCDPEKAAELRDQLVAEDHLALALELCKRCSGEQEKAGNVNQKSNGKMSWHILADPVREAKAVGLQKLRRFEEARQEFSKTEAVDSHGAEQSLLAFEDAMRYPPLFDLAALEHQRSIYTFNSLQRKLYRSTATMANMPIFLMPGNSQEAKSASRSREAELSKLGIRPVPVVPISKSPTGQHAQARSLEATGEGWNSKWSGDSNTDATGDREGNAVANEATLKLAALENRLQDAVQTMRERSRLRQGLASLDSQRKPRESSFVNAVTFLTPSIHPTEMSRWSTLTDMPVLGGNKSSDKVHNAVKKDAGNPGEATAEEPKASHGSPILLPEDKERPSPEEASQVAAEADQAGDAASEEEGEVEVDPEVSYDKLTMDMATISCACSSMLNLRGASNLWPEDRQTHSLMPASPMALPWASPLAATLTPLTAGWRLNLASFNELMHFQERYGSAESLISMLVRERRLAQACQYIFNEKANKHLFVDVVARHCLAHNQFHELQEVILDFDPSLRRVQEYLNSVKDFLRDRRALDVLYSYEVFTKNYVNAGVLAIQLFTSSSTWDARVGHLQNAEAHLDYAYRRMVSRRRGHPEGKDSGSADIIVESSSTISTSADAAIYGGAGETAGVSGVENMTESDIKRSLETVRIQMEICEAMPVDMPHSAVLFGPMPAQCEVAETLMIAGHFGLAQKVIEFLDLPAVELCIRASNQIATQQARSPSGSIMPVVKFLEAIPKLPPVEWDSLVSNVVNIWIIEKEELKADRSAATQLIRYIVDERCKMDAHILTGNLHSAFQIAQRLGNMQDVLHINSRAQAVGDQELLKNIASFLAYNPVSRKR